MEPVADFLQMHDMVRVVRLRESLHWFGGMDSLGRAPQVGDQGRVISVEQTGSRVVVEMRHHSGHTVWQAAFQSSELELVWRVAR